MSKSKILKIPIIIIISFCLLYSISFIASCKVTPEPEELLEACKQGNFEEAERLLEQGIDVKAKDDSGWTTLMRLLLMDVLRL